MYKSTTACCVHIMQNNTQKTARPRAHLIRQSLLRRELICNPNSVVKHIDVPLQLHLNLHLPLYELINSLDAAEHRADVNMRRRMSAPLTRRIVYRATKSENLRRTLKGLFLKNDFMPANILHRRSHLQTRRSRCPGKGKNKILWVFRLE